MSEEQLENQSDNQLENQPEKIVVIAEKVTHKQKPIKKRKKKGRRKPFKKFALVGEKIPEPKEERDYGFKKNRTKISNGLLTPRQTEITRLISLGCTIAEAALIMGVSMPTATNHKALAIGVLGVNKNTLMVRRALQLGITTLEERLTPEEKAVLGDDWEDGWN